MHTRLHYFTAVFSVIWRVISLLAMREVASVTGKMVG